MLDKQEASLCLAAIGNTTLEEVNGHTSVFQDVIQCFDVTLSNGRIKVQSWCQVFLQTADSIFGAKGRKCMNSRQAVSKP